MNSLRSLFRWMLLGWLALVLLASVIVARSTDSAEPGNLLAFLFTRAEAPQLPPLPEAPPVQKTPEPAPTPSPAPAPPASTPAPTPPAPTPSPEWVPLAHGRQAGKGSLGKPDLQVLEDGSLEVRLSCSGAPGHFMTFRSSAIASLSVDLQGDWDGTKAVMDRRLAEGCVRRLQIGQHPKWLRVSAVTRKGRLAARVEHSAAAGAIRIVFSVEP